MIVPLIIISSMSAQTIVVGITNIIFATRVMYFLPLIYVHHPGIKPLPAGPACDGSVISF